MTFFIPAYDTENPACLEGVRRIVEIHESHEMPATFFMVARLLEEQGGEYRALLKGHPWSLHAFDPSMRMVDMTFSYAVECGFDVRSFSQFMEQFDGKEEGP